MGEDAQLTRPSHHVWLQRRRRPMRIIVGHFVTISDSFVIILWPLVTSLRATLFVVAKWSQVHASSSVTGILKCTSLITESTSLWRTLCDLYNQKKINTLLFYVLTTSKVISGRVPMCDSLHSWRLHSIVPLGDQACSTQSPIHSVTLSCPCPILIMLRA